MTKTELIKILAKARERSTKDAQLDVEVVLGAIQQALANGETVSLTGFGTFSVREQAEKKCMNPKTKETMIVPAHKKAAFKAGKALKDAVNGSESKQD